MNPTMSAYATGMVRPRSTALFFDKLWIHPVLIEGALFGSMEKYAVPREVCIPEPVGVDQYYLAYGYNMGFFYWDAKFPEDEDWNAATLPVNPKWHGYVRRSDGRFDYMFRKSSIKHFHARDDRAVQSRGYEDTFGGETSTRYRNRVIRDVAATYCKMGQPMTAIYLSPVEYDKGLKIGDEGVEVCLDFVPVVVDSKLSWAQVLELRHDKDAQTKLRRLRRWFDLDLRKKEPEVVRSQIAKRLDDYEWALRKHGIETTIGGMTSVISFAAGPVAAQLAIDSPLAAVAGGLVVGSAALAWVGRKRIERLEIERDEVAYLYEVRSLAEAKSS